MTAGSLSIRATLTSPLSLRLGTSSCVLACAQVLFLVVRDSSTLTCNLTQPRTLLEAFPLSGINMHPSLLPRVCVCRAAHRTSWLRLHVTMRLSFSVSRRGAARTYAIERRRCERCVNH